VFWPYAYDYRFGYTFSPWRYYDPFWGYGPFALFASLFWPYAWAPYYADGFGYYDYGVGLPFTYGDVYGYPDYARTRVARAGAASRNRAPGDVAAAAPTAMSEMCSGQAGSLTGLPIDQIDRTIQPTGDQRAGLDALKAASVKVTDVLATSCPSEIPMMAPGRWAAMQNRLEATRRAVETVRAPLERFYGSLSDEQKAQFDAMKVEPELQATQGWSRSRRTVVSSAQAWRAQTLYYSAAFPEQEIEKSIQATEAQKAALDELRAAATKESDLLKDTCPTEMPSTPTLRLAALQARLDAMLEVVKTERPAMEKFYSLLSDEQKARFNAFRPPQQPNRHQGWWDCLDLCRGARFKHRASRSGRRSRMSLWWVSSYLFIGPRRGQRSREMLNGKVRISMKPSQRSFNELLRIHPFLRRPQHLFKFDFERIEFVRRHDELDPQVMENDDEMRQQPSHDPPENREQSQGAADQEGGDVERNATERRGRRRGIGQAEERKENKAGDERPTNNPTSWEWFPGYHPLGRRLGGLPYPPKYRATNEEEEAADAEPEAWADQPHNLLCDHNFTPHPESGAVTTMTSDTRVIQKAKKKC
jgi:hypothetical protein